MERFPIHICPTCHRLQALTARAPSVLICERCGHDDIATITSLFGREEWDIWDTAGRLMLDCLRELEIELTPRKQRLLCCGAARTQFRATGNPSFRRAITLAEEWADAGTRPTGVAAVQRALSSWRRDIPVWAALGLRCLSDETEDLQQCLYSWGHLFGPACREQFGNPFLPVEWNPDWYTSTVHDLAAHIYARHEFSSMPILADALQDAGCDDEQVLAHCRGNAPHARGCWVLDAVLGRA
jgi:hypothetical protein